MHNPESTLENVKLKIRWDFEIQADLIISARRPDIVTVNNNNNKKKKRRNCRAGDFVVPADHWIKLKENEKKDKYLARKLKNYGT